MIKKYTVFHYIGIGFTLILVVITTILKIKGYLFNSILVLNYFFLPVGLILTFFSVIFANIWFNNHIKQFKIRAGLNEIDYLKLFVIKNAILIVGIVFLHLFYLIGGSFGYFPLMSILFFILLVSPPSEEAFLSLLNKM